MPLMTRTRQLVLWIKQGDPPSERAILSSEGWQRVLPNSLNLKICPVDPESPEVSRVPCLQFQLDHEVVYCLEGDITLDAVLGVLRRLG